MLITWLIIPVFLLYSILIIYYWRRWEAIPEYEAILPFAVQDPLRISVVIPARNEEENIGRLLDSLLQQTYPKELFEIIVADDYSEDGTAAAVSRYPDVKLIRLQETGINSYKKKALEKAIGIAVGDLIVATDADCLPPPTWLETIASFKKEKNSVFIASPVVISCDASMVQMFQALDFMVLQGITAAAVSGNQLSMCNGANVAYEKKAFEQVGGFAGVDHIASGDDMLLMHKVWKSYPERVHYLKSRKATVTTSPVIGWKDFFRQRIRWASKARQYDDKRILPVLVLVYLLNLFFVVLLVAGFFNPVYFLVLGALWVLKTLVEWPFFASLARYFRKAWAIPYFFFFQPLHILYTIISGLFGQFGKYEWKGRRVQ